MSEQQQPQHHEEPLTQVFVSNISPSSNEQTLASFFSFCGTITNLKLTSHSDNGTKEAIVSFENEAAAKTALLLTNAVIADRPITVVPYSSKAEHKESSSDSASSSHTTEISGDQIPNKNHPVPADQRSHVSVIAGLLAAGYTLGSDAFTKARQVDEQNQLSTKLAAAATATKEKFQALDQTYQISEKVGNVVEGVTNKAKEVDQNWKISENVSSVVKNVTDTAEVLSAKANEHPAVQSTMSTLSYFAENVSNFFSPGIQAINQQISTQAAQIREETNHHIDEKMKAREVEKKSQQPAEEVEHHEHQNQNPNPNPTDSHPSAPAENVEQK
jgi:RNA recognition motif-containing protein